VQQGFVLVVYVVTAFATAGLAVILEEPGEIAEQIGVGTEVADVVAATACVRNGSAHRRTRVAMKAVSLDDGGGDIEAAEDVLEGRLDGRGAGARRTRDCNDWMLL